MADRVNASQPSVIQADMAIVGDIRNCAEIQVLGMIDGSLSAERASIAEGGRVHGETRVHALDVSGEVQGEVHVRDLVRVTSSGVVAGDLKYSKIEVESGGTLSADLRNVPPKLFGDYKVEVARGKEVPLTSADLTAVDPDDSDTAVIFQVSNVVGCKLALAPADGGARVEPAVQFSVADIKAGRVAVVHDGAHAGPCQFDVVAQDGDGATSGGPTTVTVAIS